jgi:hypothetical protein
LTSGVEKYDTKLNIIVQNKRNERVDNDWREMDWEPIQQLSFEDWKLEGNLEF